MKKIALIAFGIFVMGCTSGNCRQVKDANTKNSADGTAPNGPIPGPTDKVKIYKYDGSLQCGMGKSVSPEDMQKDLKGLKVYSASSKTDGLMHIQQCGTPTGKVNVFEIDRKDLATAKKLGFKEWTMD